MDVTIIIPTYNRMWSLPKAVASCFVTSIAVEVIVIDDGSTDETFTWLQKQKDVMSVRQENQGKDWAVNLGVSLATGKYIRFLDSDDWVLPYSTDKLFEAAEKQQLDVVAAGHHVFDETENLVKEIPWTNCDDFISQQLGECDSSHYSAYLFNKTFIKDIPHRQEYGSKDDRQFIIEVALRKPRQGYIAEPTLGHRVHSKERLQSAGGLKDAINHAALLTIYKKSLSKLENSGELSPRYTNAALNILWPLAHWIAKYDIDEATLLMNWIYKLKPGFIIPEKGLLGLCYKRFGFKRTEQLLRLRRFLKTAWG